MTCQPTCEPSNHNQDRLYTKHWGVADTINCFLDCFACGFILLLVYLVLCYSGLKCYKLYFMDQYFLKTFFYVFLFLYMFDCMVLLVTFSGVFFFFLSEVYCVVFVICLLWIWLPVHEFVFFFFRYVLIVLNTSPPQFFKKKSFQFSSFHFK